MKKTLFLVMDMMNDLVAEDGFSAQTYGVQVRARNVLANTAAAIAAARAGGAQVGYVRVGFSSDYREAPPASPIFSGARANGIFQLGTWGTEVHPELAPQPQDFDIIKHRVSPFYATALEAILRANGIERIVMCGVSTNGVVHSGAREAHDRDYEVVILQDCCAGVTADEHLHAIACLGRYAAIVDSTAFAWSACGHALHDPCRQPANHRAGVGCRRLSLPLGALIVTLHRHWATPAGIAVSASGARWAFEGAGLLASPGLMARLFTRPDAVSALQAGQAVGGIVGLYLLAVALFGSSA